MKEDKTEVFILKLPRSLKDKLTTIAKEKNISMAEVVREAIESYSSADPNAQTKIILEAIAKIS